MFRVTDGHGPDMTFSGKGTLWPVLWAPGPHSLESSLGHHTPEPNHLNTGWPGGWVQSSRGWTSEREEAPRRAERVRVYSFLLFPRHEGIFIVRSQLVLSGSEVTRRSRPAERPLPPPSFSPLPSVPHSGEGLPVLLDVNSNLLWFQMNSMSENKSAKKTC